MYYAAMASSYFSEHSTGLMGNERTNGKLTKKCKKVDPRRRPQTKKLSSPLKLQSVWRRGATDIPYLRLRNWFPDLMHLMLLASLDSTPSEYSRAMPISSRPKVTDWPVQKSPVGWASLRKMFAFGSIHQEKTWTTLHCDALRCLPSLLRSTLRCIKKTESELSLRRREEELTQKMEKEFRLPSPSRYYSIAAY